MKAVRGFAREQEDRLEILRDFLLSNLTQKELFDEA